MKAILIYVFQKIIRITPNRLLEQAIMTAIQTKATSLEAKNAITLILKLDNFLYELAGPCSKRYNGGIHTKHRHIKYHDFFKERIPSGSRILDIGCGYGSLANTISTIKNVHITSIDIEESNICKARALYKNPNINFIVADVYEKKFDGKFDIVVMSNVLEHLSERVTVLKKLKDETSATKFLLRVPVFSRDWKVPLKKELGIEWRLDPTHLIEYDEESIVNELTDSGLKITHFSSQWGEFWIECEA